MSDKALFFLIIFIYGIGIYFFLFGLSNLFNSSLSDNIYTGLYIFGAGFIVNFIGIYYGSKHTPLSNWWRANVFFFFAVLIGGLLIFVSGLLK